MAHAFDVSRWGVLSAFKQTRRIGGAAIARGSPDVDMLEGRKNLAVLWDLRVHPDLRNEGIGHKLFERAVEWSRERHCIQLKVETRNINVPACRFYARQGCQLRSINPSAYEPALDEIQLLWYKDLV